MSEPKGQTLEKYLQTLKSSMGNAATLHCIVGNEAADLDSIASALVYAYFRSSTAETSGTVFVPFIPIPRDDFKLRTEAVFLFSEAGVDPQLLIFSEDIDLKSLYNAGKLELPLVDHNRPTGLTAGFTNAVAGVIDHHADEGLFENVALRKIEPVGSAATLVAELILGEAEDLLDAGVTTLLLGTILLDTVNLDPEAKRVTPKDETVAAELLKRSGIEQKALFNRVQHEKFNVSALDSDDLLRKDYKQWELGCHRVGISSVLLSFAEWLQKDASLSQSLARYAESRDLDVLLAMNAYTAPEFTRELGVYCPDGELRAKLLDYLEQCGLELTPITAEMLDSSTALFAQGNLGISRKKLQPMLAGFFASLP